MAQLGNLLVTGSSRLLGKLFCNDISVGNSLSVKTLSATNFTATSITTSGLTVNGNATTTGTLNVGNSQANGKISVNGKVAIRDYGYNWLGINDGYAGSPWSAAGVFFGKSLIRTDNAFQLGNNGDKVLFNTSSAKFTVPVTINNSLAANNITATNVTVNDTLKAYKYELNTIQDLGGEFCVAPTIYIQSGATVQVNKDSATTIVVSIKDTNAIKSDTIQGVRWAQNSKIKFQGKINGLSIRCNGVMKSKLNTVQNTMSLTLTVDSNIANSFSASVANATSYSNISVMLYQRYGKKIGSTTENVYSPVGIRMSAVGSANAAPYVDIWGSKSSSDPDTVYTIPSVRLGYLGDLSMTLNGSSISCNGYGLYADNVYLNGTIISNSGTIGGFGLDSNSLHNGTWGTDKSVLVCTGTDTAKTVGGSASISGWCFTAGSKFGVTTSGDLYASNAIISGKVTSSSGTIGGFTISQYNIKGTNVGLGCANGHDYAFWAGNSTGSASSFRVGHDGSLVASKATITGTITTSNITATGGTIGGCKIENGVLKVASANITSVNASNITSGTLSADRIGANSITVSKITTENLTGTNGWINLNKGTFNYGSGKLVWDGATLSMNGTIKTTDITATGGTIAGFNVTGNHLAIGNWGENNSVLVCTGTSGSKSIGGSNSISGWCFTAGSNFGVTKTGAVYSNKLYATGGTIGGFDIDSNSLTSFYTINNGDFKLKIGGGTAQAIQFSHKEIDSKYYPSFDLGYSGQTFYYYQTATKKDGTKVVYPGSTMYFQPSGGINIRASYYDSKTDSIINHPSIDLKVWSNTDGSQLPYISSPCYKNKSGYTLGEYFSSNGAAMTLSDNSWTNTNSKITFYSNAIYIITGVVFFTQSPKGKRGVRFGTTASNYFADSQVVLTTSSTSTSGDSVCVQCTYIYNCTSATTVYLQALQQSGKSLNISNSYMKAVRIA